MKKALLFALSMVFAIGVSLQVSGQKTDYNGIWKLDVNKSTLTENTPVLVKINVTIKGDSLLTERFYDTGDGQEYPFTENLTLDNKEYNISIYNMPRKSKASVSSEDGSVLVESTTTVEGNGGTADFISKEVWKADTTNKTLTISCKNSMAGEESTVLFLLNKSE
jgi:hypothetical protein